MLAVPTVVFQLHYVRKDMRLKVFTQIQDTNRALVEHALDDTSLARLLEGGRPRPPAKAKAYAQLWFNQIYLIHHATREGHITRAQSHGYTADFRQFLQLPFMRTHWPQFRPTYAASFQRFVDDLLKDSPSSSKPSPKTAGLGGKTKSS
ncbi:MAG: DUF6082 family protein [Verrucomicrobiota bacterium JB022]|nr:DUF6082 family protein [Verrucomicrobiota bacterium JB022]